VAGTCRAAAAQRLAPWRGDDQPFARKAALSERAPTSVAEHAAQTSIDLADERWPRKVKDDLALHLRQPTDTKVRLECKRAPSVRFNPIHKA
jgi:hypothetical protein